MSTLLYARIVRYTTLAPRRDGLLVLLLAALTLPLNAAITAAAGLEMHFDEAQYWEWSQQLDWGYYSKGPLIAWLIAAGEALFGHGEWQTRLFGWVAHAITIVLVFHFARQVWQSRRAAWWAALLFATTPLYFVLSLVMTTDNLMLLFWTWALWASYRALILNKEKAWYECGAAIGLGALTKLSIGLLPFIVGLLVLGQKRWWHHLRSPHLWLSLVLMLALMSPMLIWNFNNDWVMLRHDSAHIASDGRSLSSLAIFVAGQFVVLSVIIALVATWALAKKAPHEGARYLKAITLGLMLFFLWKASGGKIQINWAAATYVSLLVLLAGVTIDMSKRLRTVLVTGISFSLLFTVALLFPRSFGFDGLQDPFKKNKYWRAPLASLASQLPPADFILTDTYHLAAELAYYWPEPLPVYITGSSHRRYNQHDLWPSIERETGKSALYIIALPGVHASLNSAFQRCELKATLPVKAWDGQVVRTLKGYYCENYQHIDWPQPSRY